MWKFYRQLVCQLPGLLWEASERVRTLIAAARFLLLAGHKEYLSEAAVSGWASFSAWWSVVPIGALFFWGLLKANHQVFLSAERAHATTVTGLTQELQLARTVVPESVAFLKAEMDRRFEEHKAQLGTMSAQIDKLTAPGVLRCLARQRPSQSAMSKPSCANSDIVMGRRGYSVQKGSPPFALSGSMTRPARSVSSRTRRCCERWTTLT